MSGTPYTFVQPDDPFQDLTNNRRWTGEKYTDLKIQKYVTISQLGIRPLLMINVTNLFNNKTLYKTNTDYWTLHNQLSEPFETTNYSLNYINETRRIIFGIGVRF
jgi:hypothetical protein